VRAFFLRVLLVGVPLACVTSIAITAQGRGNAEAAKVKNPVAATPESIAAGRPIFQRYCATCHGVAGEGGTGTETMPPPPSLVDAEWRHGSTDGEIFSTIKNGVPPDLFMEPWGDRIKDPDIWNVVNYVRSLTKKK